MSKTSATLLALAGAMTEGSASTACTLPYPDKYHAAVKYVNSDAADDLHDDVRLVLYGLQRQADDGPCTASKPWGWNMEESAKHQAWSGLGNMSPMEAMRLFVRTLEEEQPNWWLRSSSAGDVQPADSGSPDATEQSSGAQQHQAQANGAVESRDGTEAAESGSWTAPAVGGRLPAARYEHAVALVDGRMFLVGGNSGGRYLSDTWVLDLQSMTWAPGPSSTKGAPPPPPSDGPAEPPPPLPPAMPPTAGHALVPWQGLLLSIGGHIKARGAAAKEEKMMVRVLDVKTLSWAVLTPSGNAPPARGSHSATLVGAKVWVFGGEDAARRPLDDVHVLNLADMSWSTPQLMGRAPSRRSAHTAAAFADRWLLVFGGGSLVHCFSDLHVLDTHTGAWSTPPTEGPTPSSRAGHAGAMLGQTWYIVGGGNNSSGCADLVALDVSPLASVPAADASGEQEGESAQLPTMTWSHVVNVDPRSAIASEGLSLLADPAAAQLVSFGGYNGKYHQEVHLFRPGGISSRSAATTAKHVLQQAVDTVKQPLQSLMEAAIPKSPQGSQAAQEQQRAPQSPTAPARPPPGPSQPKAAAGSSDMARLQAELEQAQRRAEAATAEAAAAKETAGHELALMRRQLAHAQSALAAAEKEAEGAGARAEEAQQALAAEQGRAFKLEAQVAELRQALSRTSDLERELERARNALQQMEASTKKGGGLFSYITGAS